MASVVVFSSPVESMIIVGGWVCLKYVQMRPFSLYWVNFLLSSLIFFYLSLNSYLSLNFGPSLIRVDGLNGVFPEVAILIYLYLHPTLNRKVLV